MPLVAPSFTGSSLEGFGTVRMGRSRASSCTSLMELLEDFESRANSPVRRRDSFECPGSPSILDIERMVLGLLPLHEGTCEEQEYEQEQEQVVHTLSACASDVPALPPLFGYPSRGVLLSPPMPPLSPPRLRVPQELFVGQQPSLSSIFQEPVSPGLGATDDSLSVDWARLLHPSPEHSAPSAAGPFAAAQETVDDISVLLEELEELSSDHGAQPGSLHAQLAQPEAARVFEAPEVPQSPLQRPSSPASSVAMTTSFISDASPRRQHADSIVGSMLRAAATAGDSADTAAESIRRVLQLGANRLAEEEIRALPKVTFGSGISEHCAVCLEVFQQGEVLTSTGCGHYFHNECITSWFRRASHCPLCRQECGGAGAFAACEEHTSEDQGAEEGSDFSVDVVSFADSSASELYSSAYSV